jgi:uncharacterized protein (DUF433 family)
MKYLQSHPKIMGGDLCVTGTRIPIDEVLFLLQQGNTLTDIHQAYPWVPAEILDGAIREALGEAIELLAAKHHA